MSNDQECQEGPLGMLRQCVENRNKVIIDIGNNKKLIANIVSYDNRFNMVLRDIIEEWIERDGRTIRHRQRYIGQMFLPGHSIRIIIKVTD